MEIQAQAWGTRGWCSSNNGMKGQRNRRAETAQVLFSEALFGAPRTDSTPLATLETQAEASPTFTWI